MKLKKRRVYLKHRGKYEYGLTNEADRDLY